MIFKDEVTSALGYAGSIAIGRADFSQGKWRVDIFHKVAGLKAQSRVEVRLLLAVHGADRVEMIHRVQAVWPAGIKPPFEQFLPPGSKLLSGAPLDDFRGTDLTKIALPKKISAEPNTFQRQWRSAFPAD